MGYRPFLDDHCVWPQRTLLPPSARPDCHLHRCPVSRLPSGYGLVHGNAIAFSSNFWSRMEFESRNLQYQRARTDRHHGQCCLRHGRWLLHRYHCCPTRLLWAEFWMGIQYFAGHFYTVHWLRNCRSHAEISG